MDLEDLSCWVCAVLGKAAIHGDTVCLEILAKKELSSAAVEALHTELGVICNDALADLGDVRFDAANFEMARVVSDPRTLKPLTSFPMAAWLMLDCVLDLKIVHELTTLPTVSCPILC